MNKSDIILRELSKEELNKRLPFAHFGWEGDGAFSFMTISDGYWSGAKTVLAAMMQNPNNFALVDSLIYPLFFNYRHSVETYLKLMFFNHGEQSDKARQDYLEIGHNLKNLWMVLRPFLNKGKKHLGSNVDLDAIEHYITAINDFDPDSMVMRYPIDKKLAKNKDTDHHFDYINFGQRMDDLCNALRQLDYDLSNPMLEQASLDELSAYLDIVEKHSQEINDFLSLLDDEIKEEEQTSSDEKFGMSLFDKLSVDPPKTWSYLSNLTDSNPDLLILLDNLFYAGRTVNELNIRLSKSPVERQREFVRFANELLSKDGLSFGVAPSESQINIYGKQASALKNNISRALSILNLTDV